MTSPPARTRIRDADRTRKAILLAATEEFAQRGFGGARIESIAERTGSSKRMIFHYFGDKAGLYRAVLEAAFSQRRAEEANLTFDAARPLESLKRLVEILFDYHDVNQNFVKLVALENLLGGRTMTESETMRAINASALGALTEVIEQGQRLGVFRPDINVLDLHLMISAFCFFRVSNRATVGAIWDLDFNDAAVRDRHKQMITETVVRWVSPAAAAGLAPEPAAAIAPAPLRRDGP